MGQLFSGVKGLRERRVSGVGDGCGKKSSPFTHKTPRSVLEPEERESNAAKETMVVMNKRTFMMELD